MSFTSPTRPSAPLQRSRLISSIAELDDAIREAQAEADLLETQAAYKDAEIDRLKSDRVSHLGSTTHLNAAIRQALFVRQKLQDAFEEKEDEIDVMKDKQKRRKAKLASIAPIESTDAPDPRDDEEAAALLEITSTPESHVFKTSDDGKTFLQPAMLAGVPTAPIREGGPHWKMSWATFEDAIDEERFQRNYEDISKEWRQKACQGSLSEEEEKYFIREERRYHRAKTEVKVIRKWFCLGQTLHPNQFMAKEYMPDAGFCKIHTLYRMANLLNRLEVLFLRGELAMQPLYFLLWRMSVAFDREPGTMIETFCRALVEEDHYAFDPVLRRAVIRSAQHTNDYNFYGRRSKTLAKTASPTKPQPAHAMNMDSTAQTAVSPSQPASNAGSTSFEPDTSKKPAEEASSNERTHKRRRPLREVEPQTSEDEEDRVLSRAKKVKIEIQIPLRPKSTSEGSSISQSREQAPPSTACFDTSLGTTTSKGMPELVSADDPGSSTSSVPPSPSSSQTQTPRFPRDIEEMIERADRLVKEIVAKYNFSEVDMAIDLNDPRYARFEHVGTERDDVTESTRADSDVDQDDAHEVQKAIEQKFGPSPFPRTGRKTAQPFIFS